MAISRVDDIDGSTPAREVTFALDGVTYQIDLSEANVVALKESLHAYIEAARQTGNVTATRKAAANGSSGRRADLSAIRAWAREQGLSVSERGRISKEILDAYDEANSATV